MVGKAGSGKTTLLRSYVQRCRRALIADPEYDWQPMPGDEIVRSHAALLERVQQLDATNPAVPFRLVYQDDSLRWHILNQGNAADPLWQQMYSFVRQSDDECLRLAPEKLQ